MSEILRATRSGSRSSVGPSRTATPSWRTHVPLRRELAQRAAGGLEVRLVWSPATDELTVCVRDLRCGVYFELRAHRHSALDVYYHPYSYMAGSGA
jgi:hypothetical protein